MFTGLGNELPIAPQAMNQPGPRLTQGGCEASIPAAGVNHKPSLHPAFGDDLRGQRSDLRLALLTRCGGDPGDKTQ